MLMIAVVGRSSVHLCARRPADGHVPLQVQVDEADPHVQRPQAPALLPLQHCESPTVDLTHQPAFESQLYSRAELWICVSES